MAFWRWVNRVILGRRLDDALTRNKEAADKLDAAIKELMEE